VISKVLVTVYLATAQSLLRFIHAGMSVSVRKQFKHWLTTVAKHWTR